jgi:hypothetical protein
MILDVKDLTLDVSVEEALTLIQTLTIMLADPS